MVRVVPRVARHDGGARRGRRRPPPFCEGVAGQRGGLPVCPTATSRAGASRSSSSASARRCQEARRRSALRTGAPVLPTAVYFTSQRDGHHAVIRPPIAPSGRAPCARTSRGSPSSWPTSWRSSSAPRHSSGTSSSPTGPPTRATGTEQCLRCSGASSTSSHLPFGSAVRLLRGQARLVTARSMWGWACSERRSCAIVSHAYRCAGRGAFDPTGDVVLVGAAICVLAAASLPSGFGQFRSGRRSAGRGAQAAGVHAVRAPLVLCHWPLVTAPTLRCGRGRGARRDRHLGRRHERQLQHLGTH